MHTGPITDKRGERGYLLITVAFGAIVAIGTLGLTLDLGRMYIGKNEAQNSVDAAAIRASLELDSTMAGINRARTAANATVNKWNLGTSNLPAPTVEFATTQNGPWDALPATGTNILFTRVSTRVIVPLHFMNVLAPRSTGGVSTRAVAGQVPKTTFKQGLFPFSPIAHNNTPPDFGLVRGQEYTLRWAGNPTLGNMCQGDKSQAMLDQAMRLPASARGFIEDTSASLIAQTIIDDYQSITRTVGDLVTMTGGAKQSQLDSLNTRIAQDSDVTSMNGQTYHGNRRRIVAVPINDGTNLETGTPRIAGIGAFLLYPTGNYGNGGNQNWCGVYLGPWLEGANHGGAASGGGAYVVRLVQ
jgi:Flp pilus assembly protein TadG